MVPVFPRPGNRRGCVMLRPIESYAASGKDILQRTATRCRLLPTRGGTERLNVMGPFASGFPDEAHRHLARHARSRSVTFGTIADNLLWNYQPGNLSDTTLTIPNNALLASVQISWVLCGVQTISVFVTIQPVRSTRNPTTQSAGPYGQARARRFSMPVSGAWRASVRTR